MSLSLRRIVEKLLPTSLASKVILAGSRYKKNKREKIRFSYGYGKSFVKKIDVLGVSFNIVLDPVKNAGVDEEIAKRGFWEKELGSQFIKNIQEGATFLDIGANIGYHSLFVASLLRGTGKVYSFEPLPHICKQLQKSIELNNFKNIEICNFGLAEKDGESTLHVRDENTGGSSILDLPEMKKFRVKETEQVILKKLDTFLGVITKVDVIKIDVEGYEYEALKGAEGVLRNSHPIIFMEFSPVFYIQESGEKPEKLINFLKDIGYSFFSLDGESLSLKSWIKEGDNIHSQIDIMCKVV